MPRQEEASVCVPSTATALRILRVCAWAKTSIYLANDRLSFELHYTRYMISCVSFQLLGDRGKHKINSITRTISNDVSLNERRSMLGGRIYGDFQQL